MNRIALAVVAAGVIAFAGPVAAQKSSIVQKIIVKVNGEIFTQSELEFRQIQALRNDEKKDVRDAEQLNTDPGLQKALLRVTPDLLIEAIDELMLVQHGREIGLKVTEENYARAIADLKKQNNITDDKTFQQAMKDVNMTMADLRAQIERAWLIQGVQQREIMRNLTLTEEEARQYYKAHPTEFMKPATVTLREIFVAVAIDTVGGQQTINAAADEAAKQKLTTARERAVKGEDYPKLVAELSESGTKANGGIIGPIVESDLNPAVSSLIATMKPGDISEPIRVRTGYQLIKLEARTGAEPEPFEKSRDAISQRILEGRLDVEKAKFLTKLRAQAVIEWKDESYKKMYDMALAGKAKTGG